MNWASKTQATLYTCANIASKKSHFAMRFSGFWLAIASSAIATAGRVGRIGETIIKGFANIFGSRFSNKCECLKGLKQLFIQLPDSILCLVFSPIRVAGNLIYDTLIMAANPKFPAKANWHFNEIIAFSKLLHNDPKKDPLDVIFFG
jgi:hypothetical protein